MTWTVDLDRWARVHPVGPDALLAVTIAAIPGAYSVFLLRESSAPPWVLWLAGGCGVVLIGSVVLRRIATESAFVVASLAMLVTVALPNATVRPVDIGLSGDREPIEIPLFYLPTSAVYLVHLYSVAAHRPQPKSLLALGVGVTGAMLCTARSATAYGALPTGWLTLLLILLALVAAAAGTWAMGVFQRQRRQRRVDETAAAADRAVVEERRRIARDMHDIVAHSLAVIVRQAEGGSAIAARSPNRAAAALSTIAYTARQALADMRGTLLVLKEGSAPEAAQPTLAEIPALVEGVSASGVDVRLTMPDGRAESMSPAAMMASYRLVQEALTNSVKHAGPGTLVTVTIAHTPDSWLVTVVDDGGNADHRPAVPGAGVGLRGVEDRVRAAGGVFEAGAVAGGFRVHAGFPVDRGAPA